MTVDQIAILGSTGSIGTQALDVAQRLPIRVRALTADRNIKLLEEQIRKYSPAMAAVADETAAAQLKGNVRDLPVKILAGEEGVLEAAAENDAQLVLNSIVGLAGLKPTLAVLKAKKTLALANKESLVAGGAQVEALRKENKVELLPVDSEHSAIFQCLQGCKDAKRELRKIILTASGGPFFGKTRQELADIRPEQALKHPNWSMGAKVTIDSATLMNKGLELMEASWLFGVPPEQIEIVVHRESILHSAVEFTDHAVIAQLGVPDMRIPIQYAFTWPERCVSPVKELDLFEIGSFSFYRPDLETFKCLRICIEAAKRGGLAPAAANGANEQAVELFLKGKIGFNDIGDLVEEVVRTQPGGGEVTLEGVLEADARARRTVLTVSNNDLRHDNVWE